LLIGWAVTTNDEVVWWPALALDRPSLVHRYRNLDVITDRYDVIVGSTFSLGSGPLCGIITSTGTWHCTSPISVTFSNSRELVINNMPSDNERIKQMNYGGFDIEKTTSFALRLNGSVLEFGPPSWRHTTDVPSNNLTFHSICTSGSLSCGIVLDTKDDTRNGSIECWGANTREGATFYDKWLMWRMLGGAPHRDYMSITCALDYACAIRSLNGGTAYCFPTNFTATKVGEFVTPVPDVAGPWLIIKKDVENVFHGISYNNSVWSWGLLLDWPPLQGVPNVIDYVNITRRNAAVIDSRDGHIVLIRDNTLPVDQEFGVMDIPLTRHHFLSTNSLDNNICVLIDGQVTCTGGVHRYRFGGYAMMPRSTLERIISISTNGSNTPYCGQKHFRACATVQYAMTLIESVGPWITFQFEVGTYRLPSPIIIDYAGITLRGSANGITRFVCYSCVVVNAPSCRLLNLEFLDPDFRPTVPHADGVEEQDILFPSFVPPSSSSSLPRPTERVGGWQSGSISAIMINSYDVVIAKCLLRFRLVMVRLLPDSSVTIMDTTMSTKGKRHLTQSRPFLVLIPLFHALSRSLRVPSYLPLKVVYCHRSSIRPPMYHSNIGDIKHNQFIND
jgi:hypothetical protein